LHEIVIGLFINRYEFGLYRRTIHEAICEAIRLI
jgi:hypothetical protein